MKQPLAFLAIIYSLGIFLANNTKIPFLFFYCLAAVFFVFSILLFKKKLGFVLILFCTIFSLGAVSLKNAQSLPKCHISRYISYKNSPPYQIKGQIISAPNLKNNRTVFIFKTKEVQMNNLKYNCCGNILVYIKGRKDLHYLEELILTGNLYRPFRFGQAKQKSYQYYLYNQGIYSLMHVRSLEQSPSFNKANGVSLKMFTFRLKNKAQKIMCRYLSPIAASIFAAMVLGDKTDIPATIYNSMIKSGTVHILVVSGFNVGIVACTISLFLKLIRLPKILRFFLAVTLLILYCLITGASNPVVRATLMAISVMFGYLVKRQADIYNSCALAALYILLVNPRQLFDVGFELSFASVISITYIYPKIRLFLRLDDLKTKYLKFLVESCLVSFSAWLGTMGLVVYYFRIFSPVTVLANLFIVPLAALITLCGFSLIAMSFLLPSLTLLFSSTCELWVSLLLNINSLLLQLPYAHIRLS